MTELEKMRKCYDQQVNGYGICMKRYRERTNCIGCEYRCRSNKKFSIYVNGYSDGFREANKHLDVALNEIAELRKLLAQTLKERSVI